jgi:hypothetical protein
MVRIVPTVEVIAPDGTKSLWAVALPHSEAVAAVRKAIPPDYTAELSIRRLHRSPTVERLRSGEVRKMETLSSKRPSDPNQLAESIIDIATGERPNSPRTGSEYRAYAVGSDGQFIGFKKMICSDDGEAAAKAKRLTKYYDIEVWNGNRFVIRLVHRPQ